MFGVKHLIILAVTVAFIVAAMLLTRKWNLAKFAKVMFYIGIISEIIKVFYYTLTNEETLGGVLPKSDLPFHLCSIQIVFIFILNQHFSTILFEQ